MGMKRLVFLLAFISMGLSAWCNGDPVARFCALTLSRNPVGVHVPEVQLKDEHLTITPMGRYVVVRVEYLLLNNSKKDFVDLPYGFPIDYYRQGKERWAHEDGISEKVAEVGWRDNYVSEVFFTLNGVQLPFQVSLDSVLRQGRPLLTAEEAAADKSGELFEGRLDSIQYKLYEYESDLVRRWYYTRLSLPAGRAAFLTVQYRIESHCYVSLTLQNSRLAFDHGRCQFAYDFSPASYWGNGMAETFDVRVDASHVELAAPPFTDTIAAPLGLPMGNRGNGIWHYTARNFDLAKAQPLRLNYLLGRERLGVVEQFNYRIAPSRYTVSVSGTDPKYPATNLSDMDLGTATVLRPDKDDSMYITIRFKEPTNLRTIVFYNGYCKSAATWLNNSRVESMMVCESGRKDPLYCEYHNPSPGYFRGWQYLPKRLIADVPESFTWLGLTDVAEVIQRSDYYSPNPVTEIHFAIAAVVKGKRYDDVCVSEIILLE